MEAIVINNANLSMSHLVSKNPIIHDKKETKERYIGFFKKYIKILNVKSKYVKAEMEAYGKIISDGSEERAYPIGFYKYYILFDLVHIVGYEPNSANLLWKWNELESVYLGDFRMASKDIYIAIVGCDYIEIGKSKKNSKNPFGYLNTRTKSGFEELLWYFQEEPELEYVESIERNIRFKKKKPYKIMITATMSAGKSTFINSLVGKYICLSQNMACTSKIHSVVNKAFEDNTTYELDYDLVMTAGKDELLNDNELNKTDNIIVSAYFNGILSDERIIINDSPGVNFSGNSGHKAVTDDELEDGKYDLLLYVMNSTQLATNDENEHLEFVKKNVGKRPIIFIMNKVDMYDVDEEDVSEVIERQIKYLTQKGFKSPIVCPVSARAGYLAKYSESNELTRAEERELYNFIDKFEKMGLVKYYNSHFPDVKITDSKDEKRQLLKTSGLSFVEKIIKKYVKGEK